MSAVRRLHREPHGPPLSGVAVPNVPEPATAGIFLPAVRSLPIDAMTTDRAIDRAAARDDRLARLAYARTVLVELLTHANDDVDDAEAELVDAIEELADCKRRRGDIAGMLYRVLQEEQAIDPVRVAGALEAIEVLG